MASMGAALRRINPDLPTPRQFQARDGASLQYYAYPAGPDQVAVLVHGSAGPGTTMHALAEALRAADVTTYVLDIRGHGGSGRRGDIDYVGQIDDDLADFVAQLGPAKSGATRIARGVLKLDLDLQQSIVLRVALAARERADLDLPAVEGEDQRPIRGVLPTRRFLPEPKSA